MRTLHDCLHDLARARHTDADRFLEEVRLCLANGCDPSEVNGIGQAPLDTLADGLIAQSDTLRVGAAARLLLHYGADSWRERGARGTALLRTLRGAVVEDGQPKNAWAHLALTLIDEMAQQEARGVLHATTGGRNPLHLACEFGAETVVAALRGGLPDHWIVQSNLQGETPLHLLWKPRQWLSDLVDFGQSDGMIQALWGGTVALLDRGGDLLAKDARMRTPLDGIRRMQRNGLAYAGEDAERARTLVDSALLEQATRNARQEARSARRL